MECEVTCRACGRAFSGNSFQEIRDDLKAHLELHANASD